MKNFILPCLVPFIVLPAEVGIEPVRSVADDSDWWSNWRGPGGTGVASTGSPPVEWSEEKNIRWKVDLPGLGSSSPIVWEDRVYVMTAIETDRRGEGAAPAQQRRRGGRGGGFFAHGGPAPTRVHEFAVIALNREDGSVAWRTKVNEAVPHEAGHQTNSQASGSPITDGERIYAHFGSRGLYCLDMDGDIVWSVDLGRMRTKLGFGEGTSPTLYGDKLIVNWDHEDASFIAAFDKRSGVELWRTPRNETTSWSTPLVVPVDGGAQVIVTATSLSRSYDVETGVLLWTLPGMTANSIPSPSYADGVAYLMSGFRGYSLQAVRLAEASGELSRGDVIWDHRRGTSYVPSALLYDNLIYFLSDNNGVLTCLDVRTGEIQYERQRLRGLRTVYSSPVGVDGRIYITSREGTTTVVTHGSSFQELASNQLDDGFDATAAIVGDELYLRGREYLYCIAEDEK